ncbi:hypothetical protein ACFQ0B_78160 [Nonomuraea thailandensis]
MTLRGTVVETLVKVGPNEGFFPSSTPEAVTEREFEKLIAVLVRRREDRRGGRRERADIQPLWNCQ